MCACTHSSAPYSSASTLETPTASHACYQGCPPGRPVVPARAAYQNNAPHRDGLTFPNPVGLAAGLDKNGDYIEALGRSASALSKSARSRPPPARQPQAAPVPAAGRRRQSSTAWASTQGVDYLVSSVNAVATKASSHQHRQNFDTPIEKALTII